MIMGRRSSGRDDLGSSSPTGCEADLERGHMAADGLTLGWLGPSLKL